MHSRIIELSKTPIEVENRICESDYYDNDFIGSVADYVTSCDRTDAIEWLAGYLKNKGVITEFNTETMTFTEDVKEKFFRDKFEDFKKLASELTFEEFAKDKSGFKLYLIQNCIREKFGFYIHYDGCYWTLDDFIRDCVDNNETWYFGGALDYHC